VLISSSTAWSFSAKPRDESDRMARASVRMSAPVRSMIASTIASVEPKCAYTVFRIFSFLSQSTPLRFPRRFVHATPDRIEAVDESTRSLEE
jgi:hypothetical protein